ncbi:unnamed protein product, partial [Brenthis ino]
MFVIQSYSMRVSITQASYLNMELDGAMKFQVFFLPAIVALALAEKDKDNKDISKDKVKDVKPIESILIQDRPLVNQPVYDVPIEDDVGKLSLMNWESAYDTSPIDVLRRLRVGAMPYIYNRGVYPGYLNYPQIYPYGRYGRYGPQQFYNNFGYYPIA